MTVCLLICLPFYQFTCLFVCLSIHLSIYLSNHLSVCLSVCLSRYLPPYLPVLLYIYVCVCMCMCVCGYDRPADHFSVFLVVFRQVSRGSDRPLDFWQVCSPRLSCTQIEGIYFHVCVCVFHIYIHVFHIYIHIYIICAFK